MARGDNLTKEDRARGGHRSHSGGRSQNYGNKGGHASSSDKGLASTSEGTRERVAREGGEQ